MTDRKCDACGNDAPLQAPGCFIEPKPLVDGKRLCDACFEKEHEHEAVRVGSTTLCTACWKRDGHEPGCDQAESECFFKELGEPGIELTMPYRVLTITGITPAVASISANGLQDGVTFLNTPDELHAAGIIDKPYDFDPDPEAA